MKYYTKFIFAFLMIIFMLLPFSVIAEKSDLSLNAPSVILVEYTTGKILFEKNPDEKKPLASVTKIMTMLLAMEEIDSGKMSFDDIVVGSAHAKSYGGSTIFLDEGERMSVNDILKGIAVASGNDAAVAIAEHIAGSEESFVERMNKKAEDLGMKNTHFVNCNGLDADGHYSTARDISLMSRELMKHSDIFKYTGIWMDNLRNGAFTLSNTNKLVRFYDGCTGLKTGSTGKAKFCISATAKRENMHLIAVIMAADTSKQRQADASALLNYGFANYGVCEAVKPEKLFGTAKVKKGVSSKVNIIAENGCSCLYKKSDGAKCDVKFELLKSIDAPVKKGAEAGEISVKINGKEYAKIKAVFADNVKKITLGFVFKRLLLDWIK